MIEVISSILDAEKKAGDIAESAARKAKEIKADGETAAEKITSDAITFAEMKRKAALAEAEKLAAEEYIKIVAEGESVAKQTVNAAYAKKAEAEKFLLDKITG